MLAVLKETRYRDPTSSDRIDATSGNTVGLTEAPRKTSSTTAKAGEKADTVERERNRIDLYFVSDDEKSAGDHPSPPPLTSLTFGVTTRSCKKV